MLEPKQIKICLLTVIALFILIFPYLFPKYLIHIGIYIAINSIAVLGLGVLGSSGQISLSQAAFYGIGAYTSSLLAVNFHFPFWLGIIAAALLAGAAGFIIGLPTIRVTGLYLVMITLGVNEIVWLCMMNLIPLTGGPQGVILIPPPTIAGFIIDSARSYYYLVICFLVFFIILTHRIFKSRLGMYFKALSTSEIAAAMVGLDVVGSKVIAFIISALWGGVAGSLYAHYIGYIHPDNFQLDISVLFLTMAVFGGQSSVMGMLLSTLILTISTEYLRNIGEYRMVAYGLLLLVGMIYMPSGIGPYLDRLTLSIQYRIQKAVFKESSVHDTN